MNSDQLKELANSFDIYQDIPTADILRVEDFSHIGRVHEWRRYIPPILRDTWSDLADDVLFITFAFAESLAESEEWD